MLIATPIGGSQDPNILDSGKDKIGAYYEKDSDSITPIGAGVFDLSAYNGYEINQFELDART